MWSGVKGSKGTCDASGSLLAEEEEFLRLHRRLQTSNLLGSRGKGWD